MSSSPKINNETAVMQAIWRLAHRRGEHRIDLPSVSDCRRIRFALYNAVRGVRLGKEVDEELAAAAEECSISIEGTSLLVRAKSKTPAMQAILATLGPEALGLTELTPRSAEEVVIESSQELLLEKLKAQFASDGTQVPGQRVTPYYTR